MFMHLATLDITHEPTIFIKLLELIFMKRMCVLLIICSIMSCQENDNGIGDQCPRPTIYKFSFQIIDSDSTDLIKSGQYSISDIRFYAENQSNLQIGIKTETIENGEIVTIERFEKFDFYTLVIDDMEYKVQFELFDTKDPENKNCGTYFISKVFVNDKELCSNCHNQKYVHLTI